MKKILFVTYDFPFPPTSGGKTRAYNLVKYANTNDVEIHLLSFIRDGYKKSWENEIKKIGVKSIHVFKRKKLKSVNTLLSNVISGDSIFKTIYYDKKFLSLLKAIINEEKIDVVHFESSYTGYYIGPELEKLKIKQILGTENIENLLYKDYLQNSKNLVKKISLSYQVERFKKEEERMMKDADMSLAVTEEEARHIREVSKKECVVIENAISLSDYKFKFSSKVNNNILFVGNFTYMPNVSAIKYFIEKVLPLLEKRVSLTVIGKDAPKFVKANNRIIVKEFVEDLISEYYLADALVFPIKIGGGTNFKILEAMALGTPIVGFSDKIENTGALSGRDFLKANNPEEFVARLEKVFKKGQVIEEIVKNARILVEEKYSWEKVGKKLAKVWKEI